MSAPLSLLILARNEEKTIARCLSPLRRHAAEIIVMDTGSTDGTVRVARSLGARILRARFKGDFAVLRNRLLAEARQTWILFLDADEVLSTHDARRLAARLRNASADAYQLEIRHYTDDYNLVNDWRPCRGEYSKEERLSGKAGFYRYSRPLLFRARPDVRYEYPIHESILPSLARSRRRIGTLPVVVHHFEFGKGAAHHLRKHRAYLRRELALLKRMPSDSPCYPMMLQSAAIDLISTGGDLAAAARLCRTLVARAPRDERHRMLQARIAMLQRRHKEAARQLNVSIALRATPDNLCLAAWNQMESGNGAAARRFLRRALRKRPWHPVSLHLMGVLLANEGRLRSARSFFDRALRVHPRFRDARAARDVVRRALRRRLA
ncbi:MAG: glycosyltransferase family 2 protein [Elusimicrobia bacterium]|nr:glycosyltransferase family 2 protein [Elusimicrobiota bacterium]